jgi:hypothetical protein
VLSEAQAWLNRPVTEAERRLLLSLLAKFDTSLVLEGIAHAVANGGKSVRYLSATLERSSAAGRRPSDPKPTTTGEYANGTHNSTGARRGGPSRRPVSPEPTDEQRARLAAAPAVADNPALRALLGRGQGARGTD